MMRCRCGLLILLNRHHLAYAPLELIWCRYRFNAERFEAAIREEYARQYSHHVFPKVNPLDMVAAEAAYTRRTLI